MHLVLNRFCVIDIDTASDDSSTGLSSDTLSG